MTSQKTPGHGRTKGAGDRAADHPGAHAGDRAADYAGAHADDRADAHAGKRFTGHTDLSMANQILEGLEIDQGESDSGLGAARARISELQDKAEAWDHDHALRSLEGVAIALRPELTLRAVIKQILESAVEALGADRGILFLSRSMDRPLIPVLAIDIDGQEVENLERVSRTILRRAQAGEFFMTTDALADPTLAEVPSIRLMQVRSVLCARLTANDELIGVLYLDALEAAHSFSPRASRLLSSFAAMAGVALHNARLYAELRLANRRLMDRLDLQERYWDLPTRSPAMTALKARIALAAQLEGPVLILGEEGSEGELVARAIHAAGPRSHRPFVGYDCAAGPRDLLEARLFGHAGGPVLGEPRRGPGLFREADRGVLYLAEIATMNAGAQARLLGALESEAVRPVGSREAHPVDVQLISSSSLDPVTEVKAGRFREDLLRRLDVLEIRIPPLRERPEDVPVLVEHFIEKHSSAIGLEVPGTTPGPRSVLSSGTRAPLTLTQEAMRFLSSLPWPGNVAQLEWLVQQVLVRAGNGPVDSQLIQSVIAETSDEARLAAGLPRPAGGRAQDPTRAIRSLAEIEREAIREALVRTRGNRSKTARLLGIRRNTLLRRIESLGVSLEGVPNRRGRK